MSLYKLQKLNSRDLGFLFFNLVVLMFVFLCGIFHALYCLSVSLHVRLLHVY